jgi:hypothetical protein
VARRQVGDRQGVATTSAPARASASPPLRYVRWSAPRRRPPPRAGRPARAPAVFACSRTPNPVGGRRRIRRDASSSNAPRSQNTRRTSGRAARRRPASARGPAPCCRGPGRTPGPRRARRGTSPPRAIPAATPSKRASSSTVSP